MDEIFLELQSIGNPRLSGTGSTIFVEYSNLKDAEMAKKEFPELVLTKSLERSPLMQIIE
jgi:4-diphosphocytidyl-2C-methyl-D-erythritol kinase